MSIRTKTAVFVILTFAIVVALLAALHVKSSLDPFREIETELALSDVGRTDRQFDQYLAGLAGVSGDWAHWDDTYEYIQDPNDRYEERNLYAGALAPLGVDLIVISDRSGSPVYAAWHTPDGDERPVPDELLSALKPGAGMFADFSDRKAAAPRGIVDTAEGAFLVASRAILQSDRSGKPLGTMMMARRVDERFVAELAALTDLDLRVERCRGACAELTAGPLVGRTDETISTDSTIVSASGEPALRVLIDGDRSIYQESLAGVRRVLLIVIVVGIFAALATILGIHALVIRRLRRLEATASEVARTDDPSIRANVVGNDEIARLADGMNHMLASVESSRSDLVAAKAGVDQASEAKSRFLSRMSHEIRTPLNAVLTRAQLLQMDAVDADSKDSADHIVRAAEHVTDLLDEFLDLARIEAGAIPLELCDIDAGAVIADAIELSRPSATYVGTTIEYAAEGECRAVADRVRLKQVVLNLVSNAVKYGGAHGPITVRTSRDGEVTVIEVVDRGPGIPKESRDRLFVPFDRLDADQGGHGGSGVGLAVSKQLVTLMHGTIDVASEMGRGSTFTVTLPRPTQAEVAAPDVAGEQVVA